MEKLMDETTDFLSTANNGNYEILCATAVTELNIPGTAKPIKKFILRIHNLVAVSNQRMRLIALPLAKPLLLESYDQEIVTQYQEYLKEEKECLKMIKKAINSKRELPEGTPINSMCGVFVDTISNIHSINQIKLTNLINTSKLSVTGAKILMPEEMTLPTNVLLVKKINTTLNKHFNNK